MIDLQAKNNAAGIFHGNNLLNKFAGHSITADGGKIN